MCCSWRYNPNTTETDMCLKITPSKLWDHDANRKGLHPVDARRWYCPWCNTRYQAKWGQIIIISRWDEAASNYQHYYMRAKVPSWAAEDVRAQFLEQEHSDCKDPEELYARLKTREPAPTASWWWRTTRSMPSGHQGR